MFNTLKRIMIVSGLLFVVGTLYVTTTKASAETMPQPRPKPTTPPPVPPVRKPKPAPGTIVRGADVEDVDDFQGED